MTLNDIHEKVRSKYFEADDLLTSLCSTDEPNTPKVLALVNNPSDKIRETCLEYITWFGMSRLSGLTFDNSTLDNRAAGVNPLVVACAMPLFNERLKDMIVQAQLFTPTEDSIDGYADLVPEATKFMSDFTECTATFFISEVVHDAVHAGIMRTMLAEPAASLYPSIEFCPKFHKIEDKYAELFKTVKDKKKAFCVIYGTDFYNSWRSALELLKVDSPPWWLDSKIMEPLFNVVKALPQSTEKAVIVTDSKSPVASLFDVFSN